MSQGLTQRALAGGDFTKGFISMVETGRVGLSLHSAQVLADRLGVPVGELLHDVTPSEQDLELQCIRAEVDLLADDAAAALSACEQWSSYGPGPLRARFQWIRARALLALDRTDEALAQLRETVRLTRSLGAGDLLARVTFTLAQTRARLGAHAEAFQLLLQVESAVSGGDVVDRAFEAELQCALAKASAACGVGGADRYLERARAAADESLDRLALIRYYHHRAETWHALGDRERAVAFTQAARTALTFLTHERSLGASVLAMSHLSSERDLPSESLVALDQAALLLGRRGSIAQSAAHVATLLAEARPRGDATSGLDAVRKVLARDLNPQDRTLAERVHAHLLAAAGSPPAEVRAAIEQALRSVAHLGPYEARLFPVISELPVKRSA